VLLEGDAVAEDGGGQRPGDVREEQRHRVSGVAVGGDRRARRGRALAAQHRGQPPVAVEPLAGLLAADAAGEGQPRLHLVDVAVQRRRAVHQEVHRRLVAVAGVRQLTAGDQPLPGPLGRVDRVLERLRPAGEEREQQARQ
jgi:hypothetical protein